MKTLQIYKNLRFLLELTTLSTLFNFFRIFASRKRRRQMHQKSHIAAFILLITYLPLVILPAVHVHHDTLDSEDYCLQCVGHFESQHHHHNDCLYCHILGQDYTPTATGNPFFKLAAQPLQSNHLTKHVVHQQFAEPHLRAPPQQAAR